MLVFLSGGSISCRDVPGGTSLLPRDDELHVDDVHVRHPHGARLFRLPASWCLAASL